MSETKKLYRSRTNRKIAGVCGGLGDYFDIDPTLIRLAIVFFTLWWGGGLLLYAIAWFIIPEEPEGAPAEAESHLLTDDNQPIPGQNIIPDSEQKDESGPSPDA